ncbi:MAG: TrmO family methyltransferase [Pseudomonadota bacterium]
MAQTRDFRSARKKNRPSRLGATICGVQSDEGLAVHVKGLDPMSGTPVLDIELVMSGFERRGALRAPEWPNEIMSSYW